MVSDDSSSVLGSDSALNVNRVKLGSFSIIFKLGAEVCRVMGDSKDRRVGGEMPFASNVNGVEPIKTGSSGQDMVLGEVDREIRSSESEVSAEELTSPEERPSCSSVFTPVEALWSRILSTTMLNQYRLGYVK